MRENVFNNTGMSSPGYIVAGKSGLVATPAAGTDSAGHLAAFRNATGKLVNVTRIRVIYSVINASTAGIQEFGFSVFKLTTYSASHTGGGAMSVVRKTPGLGIPTANVPAATECRIASTSPLTDGTHDAVTLYIGGNSRQFTDQDVTPIVPNQDIIWEWAMPDGKAIPLIANEGILISNDILGGTASSVRCRVELELQVV